MPTLHVSMPQRLYDELKEVAQELGTSMSDLVKMFIAEGLKRIREEKLAAKRRAEENDQVMELLMQLVERLERLEQSVDERLTMIEGDIYKLNRAVKQLKRRVDRLEAEIEEEKIPVNPELIRE